MECTFQKLIKTCRKLTNTLDTISDLCNKCVSIKICRDYNPMKERQRKQNHNEAEKKRVRNINKCVDDLKLILDVRIELGNDVLEC